MNDIAISVKNLSKKYHLYDSPKHRLKEALHPFRKKYHHDFWALKDVSFEVKKGESIGIIGKNGSGKSTLLQILCGVLQKTTGEVAVNGKASALLELGAGFNPELTGRENVYMNGAIMGFNKEEMDERIEAIIEFADIGEFIDQPVKIYSSGMFVRLAFACAVNVDPDILIIDEALSVGDIFFQQKCHQRMEELMENGVTSVIVSHDMRAIEKYSTKVILFDSGGCLFVGHPNEAVHRYYELLDNKRHESSASAGKTTKAEGCLLLATEGKTEMIEDWPQEDAFFDLSKTVIIGKEDVVRCTKVALCNDRLERCGIFQVGEVAYFYFEVELLKEIDVPIGGIEIINTMNIVVHSKGSLHCAAIAPGNVCTGERVRFRQTMELRLSPGEYTFLIVLATMNTADYANSQALPDCEVRLRTTPLMRVEKIGSFLITDRPKGVRPFYGYVDLFGDTAIQLVKK